MTTDTLTLDCLHCGPVVEDNPPAVRVIRHRLAALAVGNVPLAPIAVCPHCNEEVPSKRITDSAQAAGRSQR